MGREGGVEMEMAERLLGLLSYLAPWLAKDAKEGSAAGLAALAIELK